MAEEAIFQPLFAAFAASFGREHDASFNTKETRLMFVTDFIPRCRRSAAAAIYDGERVIDGDGWERHVWDVALCDLLSLRREA